MTAKIKNCGLKTPEALHAAAASGASFAGFVHHIASPRHLSLEDIAALCEHAPGSLAQVLVLVDPSNDLLDEIQRFFRPHYLQIHSVTKPERLREIEQRTALNIIAALKVRTKDDLAHTAALEEVSDHLLFDGQDSGSGTPFDWTLLAGLSLKKPWFLAGGLTPDNVAEALRITHAPMVDVSSGIESASGLKSLEKIAAFNTAVLQAGHD